MKMLLSFALLSTAFIALHACAPMDARDTSSQETPATPSTIEIGGVTYDRYTLWACREYAGTNSTVLELVRIDKAVADMTNSELAKVIQDTKGIDDKTKKKLLANVGAFRKLASMMPKLAFLLLEGRKEYTQTSYTRDGIDHRWDWEDGGKYSFIVKPDGTGLYYNFTNVKKGASIKASDVFKCRSVNK